MDRKMKARGKLYGAAARKHQDNQDFSARRLTETSIGDTCITPVNTCSRELSFQVKPKDFI